MRNLIIKFYLWYIRTLAKVQLSKVNPVIVGISGSSGKTSTLNAIHSVLRDHKKCKVSHKANSETGIPLDILGIHPEKFTSSEWIKILFLCAWNVITNNEKYDVYIVEMGVDGVKEPKNMAYLLKIFQPTVAVYLNVNSVHSEYYESALEDLGLSEIEKRKTLIDIIARDKNLLIENLPNWGCAILNIDDRRVAEAKPKSKAKVYKISTKERSDTNYFYLHNVNSNMSNGFSFDLTNFNDNYYVRFSNLILPDHYSYTFASALAVAKYFKLDVNIAISDLKKYYRLPPGRSSLFQGKRGSLIIDSSYNSTKEPAMDMLELLSKYQKNYKIALLGDMRELGSSSEIEHRELARFALDKADEFVLVGTQMNAYFQDELVKNGFNSDKIHCFEKAGDAARYVLSILEDNHEGVVLVKGSQNTIFLEIAVSMLMTDEYNKFEVLCRRGSVWDKKRAEYL